MSFDFPLGIFGLAKRLLKKPLSGISKYLFYRAYWISTLYKSHRQRLGQRPHRLATGLEYDLHLGKYYLARQQQAPQLWLRATDGHFFSKVVLTVTGTGHKVRHQATVVLYGVDSMPVQAPIGLPFRDMKFYGESVDAPYESILTQVRELYAADGTPVTNLRSEARLLDPIDNLPVAMGLRRGDVEEWGEVFNLEFLEQQIDEERRRLIGNPFRMSGWRYWAHQKVFNVRWVVQLLYWRKNIVTARQLGSEFNAYMQSTRRRSEEGTTSAVRQC